MEEVKRLQRNTRAPKEGTGQPQKNMTQKSASSYLSTLPRRRECRNVWSNV